MPPGFPMPRPPVPGAQGQMPRFPGTMPAPPMFGANNYQPRPSMPIPGDNSAQSTPG